MEIIALNIVGAILLAVLLLAVNNRFIRNQAIKRFVIPDLERGGYELNDVTSVKFLQTGQFRNEKIHIRPFTRGYPVYSKYVDLTYSKPTGESRSLKVTAKISVVLLFVHKVEYSHPL